MPSLFLYRLSQSAGLPKLREEILKVAGIACQIENNVGLLPQTVEAMLAWVVREGTTNVVRHSRARHCTVQLVRVDGIVTAEIRDDGRGLSRTQDERSETAGDGLSGLAERVANFAGAKFEVNDLPEGGFYLRVSLPLQASGSTDEGQP